MHRVDYRLGARYFGAPGDNARLRRGLGRASFVHEPSMPPPAAPTSRRKRWLRRGLLVLATLVLFLVGVFARVTFIQARAMTNYAPVTIRTTRVAEATSGRRFW